LTQHQLSLYDLVLILWEDEGYVGERSLSYLAVQLEPNIRLYLFRGLILVSPGGRVVYIGEYNLIELVVSIVLDIPAI